MNEFQTYRFRKVLKDLFACAEELTEQLDQTRRHCKEIEEVMRAIRQNSRAVRQYPLPKYPHVKSHAANDG